MSDDKRAVSVVIATVIIVAVTIALAIAVAYWMGGLATIFTRFEKIEIKNSYVKLSTSAPYVYTVTLSFVNTGATATSIDSVTMNGVPTTDPNWGSAITAVNLTSGFSCPIGVQRSGTLSFAKGDTDPSGNALTSGVTLTIDLHSTGSKDYYTSVALP